jgi:hypothetical protein
MAKKDPYKNIQKRFVQARAGDVEYDDLSVEDRERYQNRFNMLSQTVEGRTRIAQKILPTSSPEQRAQLKQRIKKNLPTRDYAPTDTGVDLPPDSGTPKEDTTSPMPQRLAPSSTDIRNMQSGFRMQGQLIDAQRKTAPSSPTKETVTKAPATTSDRYGSGFFSIPKSPIAALKEFGKGFTDIAFGVSDITERGYINPVINQSARVLDIVGGVPESQRFEPLPQLSNKEIAIESALTVGTAGAGKIFQPLIRPTGKVLSSVARGLSGRAPATAAALGNIADRQAARASVRAATAMSEAGKKAREERVAALGTDIGTGKVPSPSGIKFNAPGKSNIERPPSPVSQRVVSPKSAAKKGRTPKASTKVSSKTVVQEIVTPQKPEVVKPPKAAKAPKAPKEVLPKANKNTQNVSKVSGTKYPKSLKSTEDKQRFDQIYDEMLESGYFDQAHGGLDAIFDPRKADDVARREKLTDREIAKINKDAERMRTDSVMREMEARKQTDDILERLNKPPTQKEIETATENYAPGFNEAFGDIEMPGTDRAFDEVVRANDEALQSILPKPKKQPKRKVPKLIDKEAATEAWVRKGGKVKPIKVEEVKPPKAPKAPKSTSPKNKKKISSPAPESTPAREVYEEPIDALDIEIAKEYPYSSTARRVYQAQRGKPIVKATGQEQIVPRSAGQPVTFEETISDKFVAAIKAEPKKKTGPDWTPRKVTKLKKAEPYSGEPVTGDEADSILFRMYDKGKKPTKNIDYTMGQPMDVDVGVSPKQFYERTIAAGDPKLVQKEIQETIINPEQNIRQGKAVNVRPRRKVKGKAGDGQIPTTKQLEAEGDFRSVPTEVPSPDAGLSSEQRRAKFYRSMFPQARSTRQARKMYEASMGRPDIITTVQEFGPIGSPLGPSAKKSPVTSVEVSKPVKFKKVLNKNGEMVNKPIAFVKESVPAIETTSGMVPKTDLPERWMRGGMEEVTKMRKQSKAQRLKSQAQLAAKLREQGIFGEEARARYDAIVRAQKAGKEYQKGNEIQVMEELRIFYENYIKEGFEQKRFRQPLPKKPKTPKKNRNKKK